MKGRSIRFRLTVWYSIALVASLAAFAAALYLSLWQIFERDVRHSLSGHIKSVESFIAEELNDASVRLPEELAEYSQALPDDTYMQVLSERGSVVFTSRPEFPWPQVGTTENVRTRILWHSHPYSAQSQTIRVRAGRWRVAFAVPLSENEALLRRLLILLLTLGPAVTLIASLGGLWLSSRALRPVDELTVVARKIGIQNLSERLAVPRTGDELQRLSETWNSMLARLEDAVSRLSRFTADASHELRTPLAIIRSTAEIACRRARPAETYREALKHIVAESERMTVLIDDLLFLARCDSESLSLPMETLALATIVEEVNALIEPVAAEKGIRLVSEISGQLPSVTGNRAALRRLTLVLVENAVKYSEPGGMVTVAVTSVFDGVHLRISDNGPGIPETELPFLFQRFFRGFAATERGRPGSGLGLALAKGIAQHHRSVIHVRSAVGQGSVFDVVFPAS